MPYLSVIVPSMRVGGIDIVLSSLAQQEWTDYELVFVDAFHSRRKDIVSEQARNRFIAVRHVGLNPNPFPVCSYSAMMNAGIVASTGEVLLLLTDYSRLPPGLLKMHADFHRADAIGKRGLMGPHRYIALDVASDFPRYQQQEIDRYASDVDAGRLDRFMWSIGNAVDRPADPHRVDGGAMAQADADPKLRMPAGPIDAGFFHCKNESFRRDHAFAVNGFDVALDGSHGWQDSDFGDRLTVKAGVQWTLDPSQVVEIANPRHVFPLAKRTRAFGTNEKIWLAKKAAWYPGNDRTAIKDVQVKEQAAIPASSLPMVASFSGGAGTLKIAMIYGEFSSAIHGPFDLEGLYTRAGLTGSESSFFNLARTLAERGHNVVAFCVCDAPYEHPSGSVEGLPLVILPIGMLKDLHKIELDAVIAWNEPDYLQYAPAGVVRIVDQQLNDWGYCRHPQWKTLVDRFVFPSDSSRFHHEHDEGLYEVCNHGGGKASVIPNSVDLDLFAGPAPERHPHRVVYCSSPDRGLHHLLSWWPEIRRRVPDAELRIFYRLEPWLARARDNDDPVGRRARYIEEALRRLLAGDYGVSVPGPVPNAQMARELQSASVLAYPCDPVRYTEGFGCSVLDACAGGCLPIISDADALGEVHGKAALVLSDLDRERWVNAVVEHLQPEKWPNSTASNQWSMQAHAAAHSRHVIADKWEQLLHGCVKGGP